MASHRQLAANRLNALRSTGPRTTTGKHRSSLNALRTGVFAKHLVLPAIGESVEDLDAFRRSVIADLAPVGVVERECADRVATLMWRRRRVMRYEVGAMSAGMTGLPPRPEAVTGDGVETLVTLPPTATTAERLAYVRAYLRRPAEYVDGLHAATGSLAVADDVTVARHLAWTVLMAATVELGWASDYSRWRGAFEEVGFSADQVDGIEWTGTLLREIFEAACVEIGRDGDSFVRAVADRLAAEAKTAGMVDELHAEEEKLVATLVEQRERAAARQLYSDETLIAKVSRAESHYSRELDRALAMLARLRALRGVEDVSMPELGSLCRSEN